MSQQVVSTHDGLVPHLVCAQAGRAMDFYARAFGAVEVMRLMAPDGERLMHGEMRIDGHMFMLADDFPEYCEGKSQSAVALGGTPVMIHRMVADCDAVVQRAAAAGATVKMPPADMFWGDRYAVIQDPFGHVWTFGTRLKVMSPDEMSAAMVEAFAQAPTHPVP